MTHNILSLLIVGLVIAIPDVTSEIPRSVVSIHYRNAHICTGILFTAKHVLTAAGCLCNKYLKHYPDNLRVHFGPDLDHPIHKLVPILVDCHPDFQDFFPHDIIGDIAIIKLSKKVRINKKELMEPIGGSELTEYCRMYTWKDKKLRLIDDIKIRVGKDSCSTLPDDYAVLLKHPICSFSPQYEVHRVDRGSPLICEDKLMGIFAATYPHENGHSRYVYTNLIDQAEYLHYAMTFLSR